MCIRDSILPAQKGIRASRLALNTHFRGASRFRQAAIGVGEAAVNGYFTANSAILAPVRRFAGYLRANAASIPNYGERYRAGEVISSSLAESTIKQVVSKWMVKKQQMRWTPRGAHLLLQVRTRVLNDDLADQFRRWHPGFTHTIEGSPAGLAVAA